MTGEDVSVDSPPATDVLLWGGRAAPWVAAAVLLAALVVLLLVSTPPRADRTLSATGVQPVAARDFSPAEVARGDALAAATVPWSLTALALNVVVAALLGFTPLGARLMSAVAAPFGGGPWARLFLGGLVLLAVSRLVTLPFAVVVLSRRRAVGLVTQSWGGWLIDVAKAFALSALVVLVVAALVRLVVLALPRAWWVVVAVGAAGLVVALSFAYPLVVEPIFNRFTPMPDGTLRTSLLALAEKDGLPVRDVLVADASRRTTALNAYVSGLGSSRRIVVYDTLLKQAPADQVRSVVAHELGHVKNNDVRDGTLVGALGAAAMACLLAAMLVSPAVQSRSGFSGPSDPRALAFALALVVVVTTLAGPVTNVVSRRIEARADLHALDLTGDPAALVEVQHRLAVTNVSDVTPSAVLYALFATHPSAPERIALARTWARQRGVAEPADLVGPAGRAGR